MKVKIRKIDLKPIPDKFRSCLKCFKKWTNFLFLRIWFENIQPMSSLCLCFLVCVCECVIVYTCMFLCAHTHPATSADCSPLHPLPTPHPPTLLSRGWTAQSFTLSTRPCCHLLPPSTPPSPLLWHFLCVVCFVYVCVCMYQPYPLRTPPLPPLLLHPPFIIRTIGYGTYFPAALLTGTSRHMPLGSGREKNCIRAECVCHLVV